MSIRFEGVGGSSSQETGDGGGLSGSPESEPDLAPIGESEWGEADRLSAPPERQEPELAPADEPESGKEGEGRTPPEEPDSSEERGSGESEPRDSRSIGQDAPSLDRLRDALDEAHDQDVSESDEAWTPFGDVPIAGVRSDDQPKHLKKPPKEVRETASG